MTRFPLIMGMSIPAKSMRYATAGDYLDVSGIGFPRWDILVAKCPDWRHEALLFVHELIEAITTVNDGVAWPEIDKFDMEGEGKDHPDPGTLESAPYHSQHMFATEIEKLLADRLKVDWDEYNAALDNLEYK